MVVNVILQIVLLFLLAGDVQAWCRNGCPEGCHGDNCEICYPQCADIYLWNVGGVFEVPEFIDLQGCTVHDGYVFGGEGWYPFCQCFNVGRFYPIPETVNITDIGASATYCKPWPEPVQGCQCECVGCDSCYPDCSCHTSEAESLCDSLESGVHFDEQTCTCDCDVEYRPISADLLINEYVCENWCTPEEPCWEPQCKTDVIITMMNRFNEWDTYTTPFRGNCEIYKYDNEDEEYKLERTAVGCHINIKDFQEGWSYRIVGKVSDPCLHHLEFDIEYTNWNCCGSYNGICDIDWNLAPFENLRQEIMTKFPFSIIQAVIDTFTSLEGVTANDLEITVFGYPMIIQGYTLEWVRKLELAALIVGFALMLISKGTKFFGGG